MGQRRVSKTDYNEGQVGDVTLVALPSIGIRGKTHFPGSDLNNVSIADLLSEFLNKKGLD